MDGPEVNRSLCRTDDVLNGTGLYGDLYTNCSASDVNLTDAVCKDYLRDSANLMILDLARALAAKSYYSRSVSNWLESLTQLDTKIIHSFFTLMCSGHPDFDQIIYESLHKNDIDDEFAVKRILYLIILPVLIVVGTFGNVFSFIILRRKQMLKVSSYLYLAVLAIIDTCVLYIGGLRLFLLHLLQVDIQDLGDWQCKVIVTFSYVVADLSVWLIIAVTVERYIVVCFPFRASSMCNVTRAKKVIFSLFLLFLAFNSHTFWTVRLDSKGICSPGEEYKYMYNHVWSMIDFIVYSIFPFISITIMNILIIKEVAWARSNRVLLSGTEHENSSSHLGTSCTGHRRCNMGEGPRLTILLLTVSFTFLVFTFPNNIFISFSHVWNQADSTVYRAKLNVARAIAELLMYANHSINFFLYCATGNKFRQQILELCRCLRRRHRGSNHTTFTHTHSIRRASQSYMGGEGGEVMVTLKSERRRSSCLSSEINGDSHEGEAEHCRVLSVKPHHVNGKTKAGDSDDNGNDRSYGKSRNAYGISRNHEKKDKRKQNGSSRHGFGPAHQVKDYDTLDKSPIGSGQVRGRASNGGGWKVYYSSSKRNRPAPQEQMRRTFGSVDDISPKDKEYILLQPTIRWCEASVLS
ncbi:thyrotropin-releasing hormone receptor-like [Physella acuta]|uniref:thyrotropin-releasing hormone receptor-like n=1 Tax=Physella acuta TaxID=109671 RepID=UPI0027DE73DF|nr:thyrotropin-releasing hormone receptor-like [Physella acuta]